MDTAIEAVRGFNRFYTQLAGLLDPRFLDSDVSLAEARVLFEIAHRDDPVAADLQAALGLDAGYVSRMLRRFEADGLIRRARADGDARRRPISLTAHGRALFETIDRRQRAKVEAMLEPLGVSEQTDLVSALGVARRLLGSYDGRGADPQQRWTMRTFRTGDMGLIVARQSKLYNEVYGWGRGIEIAIGEAATTFLRGFVPGRAQGWIAEVDGVMAGSVLLTDEGDGLARLRLLYVEPFARGLGIGGALVRACVAFAHEAGYRSMTLWTHTILESARRLYAAEGFRCIETWMHGDFGGQVQSETWRLELGSQRRRPVADAPVARTKPRSVRASRDGDGASPLRR